VPRLVKAIAQNHRTKGQDAFSTFTLPMHPRSNQSRPKLFDAALDHPAPNRKPIFTRFQVLHSPMIVVKITCFAPEYFCTSAMGFGEFSKLVC
jgi:hypothetical protein